ncbi:MAG: glycosyltransferase family 4 protein [Candidatus Riflebacteria bacterium]|nr:glycosyltransferase family 4 protein [Candidatus Riflebacteria bacterium]
MSKTKKILIISQYYWPDITAAAFRIKETAELIAEFGYDVTVITAIPHRGWAEKTTSKSLDSGKVQVYRTPIFPIENRTKLNFILHYSSFMFYSMIQSERLTDSFDAVICTSPPLFVAIAGFFISQRKRCPLVLDIRDLWPDSAVTIGQLNRNGIAYKIAKVIEKKLYQKADLITCVANPMAKEIAQCTNSQKISVIYNGFPKNLLNDNLLSGQSGSDLFKKDCLNVVYIGNYGFCQNLELLLDAAKLFQDEHDTNFMFHIFGDGAEGKLLRDKRETGDTRNFVIHNPVEKEAAISLMNASDFLFLQLKPDETMTKTIPSKVFDYLAAGKPVIYGIEGEGRKILERSGANTYFVPGNLNSLISALRTSLTMHESLTEKALINRKIVLNEFTREKMVEKMIACLETVFRQNS